MQLQSYWQNESGFNSKGHTARDCLLFNISHSIKPISRLDFPAHPCYWLLIYPTVSRTPLMTYQLASHLSFLMSQIHSFWEAYRNTAGISPLTKVLLTSLISHFWFRQQTNKGFQCGVWAEQMYKVKFKWVCGCTKSGRYLQPSTLSINNSYLQQKKTVEVFTTGTEKQQMNRNNEYWRGDCSLPQTNWASFEPFQWVLLQHLLLLRRRTQTWY